MKKIFAVLIAAFVLTFILASSMYAQTPVKKTLTLEIAKKIAAAAETEALKNKWTMVIAIVDDGGHLVYLQRIDNTQIGSIDVAIQKAKTAISFKRPTKAYEEQVTNGRMTILSLPGVLPFEGGIPLVVNGQFIGAIGVSGGSPQQDGIVAKAGADVLPGQ